MISIVCIHACSAVAQPSGVGLTSGESSDTNIQLQTTEKASIEPHASFALTDKYFGMAWFHYSEKVMQLRGPTLNLRLSAHNHGVRYAPDVVDAEWFIGSLNYTSHQTGSLMAAPAIGWRLQAKWNMPVLAGQLWQLGAEYDGFWNDLRGSTSTGHHGYVRLSNKLWLMTATAPQPEAELQFGVLLRGWQYSELSQANSALPDIINVQKHGWTWRYQHRSWSIGSKRLFPWLRYTEIRQSDRVGTQGWYEPHNRTLDLGIQMAF